MKKVFAILLSLSLLFSLAACSKNAPSADVQNNGAGLSTQTAAGPDSGSTPEAVTDSSSEKTTYDSASFTVDLTGVSTLDELEERIEEHLASCIDSLNAQWDTLSSEVDTYEKYEDNADKVTAFYQTIVSDTEQMCIMLREYTAVYARMILDSDMSDKDKYKAADGIEECLYDDACDEICDEIYDGLLDDMLDYYYNGILDDYPDDVDYDDWYELSSNEYEQWYKASSDTYESYYDTASAIYSFYYDLSSELYSSDSDGAEKEYERFTAKIAKDKGQDTGNTTNPDAAFDTAIRSADSTEELESVVEEHVNECVQALFNEWETFSSSIDTYEKYEENADAVEEFHEHVTESASQILTMICEYGVSYARLILESGASTKDMYKAFEDFKDCIYDDACKIVKDEIYEELLGEMKDYYYDGIINDAKDDLQYSDWSDARSDAYGWWSDARSDVYSDWSDTRSVLYSFFSDMRGELYSGDLDDANEELEDFENKVSKMN